MRKHIYVHSSDLECTRELRDSIEFEPPYQYPSHEFAKTSLNEYGRLKTDNFFVHLLLGQIIQPGCPWCDSQPMLTKVKEYDGRRAIYCMQCLNCGARGPLLNVARQMEEQKEMMDEVESILKARYGRRIPWDKELHRKEVNVAK